MSSACVSTKGVPMKRFFVVALFVLAVGAKGTTAVNESGTVTNPKQIPDSIVISSNKFPTAIEKDASSVTILSNEDIKNSHTVLVSELLKQVPGLNIVRSGGAGGQTSVFMRGTNSNHTLVIIDGVEMNNPSSATTSFDFGSLNSSNIERIEILRGPQSVLYGSDAIGGVIQIFTKRGFGNLKTELSAEGGAYNSYNESVRISGSEDKIDYSLFLARKDSDGFSSIREDAGATEKDQFKSTDAVANIGYQIDKNYELNLNYQLIDANADIDQTFGVLDDPNSTTENKTNNFRLRFKNYNEQETTFKPEFSVAFTNQKVKTLNPEDDTHVGDNSFYDAQGKRIKFSAQNVMKAVYNIQSIIGLEYEEERFSSTYQSSYVDYFTNSLIWSNDDIAEVSTSTISMYALDEWTATDKLSLSAGLRYDNHEDFGSQVTYRFTSLYKFQPIGLTIKGTIGSAFKAPSLYQLNHSLYGNKNLQPEENLGWEIGFEKTSPDKVFLFGVTYFSNEIDNLIGYDENFVSINIAEASSKGIEAFAGLNFRSSSVLFNVTYNDVKDKTNQSKILRRPKEKISLKINQQLSSALQASLLVLSVGDRYDRDFRPWPYEDIILEGYTTVNMTASYKILQNAELTGRIDNVFNVDYQDVLTYNTPKRSGYVGLRITL